MKLGCTRPCAEAQWGRVRQHLGNVEHWGTWLPGVSDVASHDGSTWLTFADVRQTRVRVQVDANEDDVRVHMVEGDIRSLDVSMFWSDGRVTLVIQLDLHSPLPGALARELETVYPARLLTALLAEANEPLPSS